MAGRSGYFCALGVVVALAAPARADAAETLSIVLESGRLADVLRKLSVRSSTGLLFSPEVVGNRRSPRVSGRKSLDQILGELLWGSGLTFRRTGAGTIIIYPLPQAEQEPAVPEILVVGRRSQNADIRRTENDIQPYRVASSREIEASHADNVDRFLRARLPSNAQAESPSQNPAAQAASNRSEVNLHGLGATQTLILIDGARMPSTPSPLFDLSTAQPDLNGLPPSAIERIETLTATAGGIYGPGATGGVVNVVLKRDYRGVELGMGFGMSDRGDSPRKRIHGRFGFTPNDGRTDVMVAFSHAVSKALRIGDRDYAAKAQRIEFARNPVEFVESLVPVNGLIVRSASGRDLTFSPVLGGASLGSSFTYLPLDYRGVAADGIATLLANAGKVPPVPGSQGSGGVESLTNRTRVTSVLVNLRHRFSDRVEGFVDLIGFDNDGRGTAGGNFGIVAVGATDAGNPFRETVLVRFPQPGFDPVTHNRLRTYRLSTGLIVQFPRAWKGEARFSTGGTWSRIEQTAFLLDGGFDAASSAEGPFGDVDRFLAGLQAFKSPFNLQQERRNRFEDVSLRLAGPLFASVAGPIALSLLAERRRERAPVGRISYEAFGTAVSIPYPSFTQTVSSLYGELRAPVVPRDAGPAVLRGLEMQLSVRHDRTRSRVPVEAISQGEPSTFTAGQKTTAYTAGLRLFPLDYLMLRGSVATGGLPPMPYQLLPVSITGLSIADGDPRRGGRSLGSEGVFTLIAGGSRQLRSETARTISFGAVLNPDGRRGPRIALDYRHIRKRGEITDPYSPMARNVGFVLAHEADYPDRVTRAPLTAADTAAGFTGGILTRVDAGALNIGRTDLDAIDLNADQVIGVGSGTVRIYGSATWQLRLKRRILPGDPATEHVGFADGPLEWRGNAGIDWDRGPFTIGINGQYYGGYSAATAISGEPDEARLAALALPGVRIRPQVYFDISAAYRLDLANATTGVQSVELRLGIQNVLDRRPPTVARLDLTQNGYGYSPYGDARRRRFELTLQSHF